MRRCRRASLKHAHTCDHLSPSLQSSFRRALSGSPPDRLSFRPNSGSKRPTAASQSSSTQTRTATTRTLRSASRRSRSATRSSRTQSSGRSTMSLGPRRMRRRGSLCVVLVSLCLLRAWTTDKRMYMFGNRSTRRKSSPSCSAASGSTTSLVASPLAAL